MQLFKPNNLSRHVPEFSPLKDQTVATTVASLLEEHYGLAAVTISAFVGANVSSQNLKIETPTGNLFLKSREQDSTQKMLREAELTSALSQLGQKVPRIIHSRNGRLVSQFANKCWVLYEFQEGEYFSGKGAQLQAAAETYGELTRAATQLFANTVMEDAVPTGLPELLSRSTISDNHRAGILNSLSEVERHREFLNSRLLPLHLDYHPLNLLMNDDYVACIVDLEHLKRYSVVSGLGFAGFKLMRQAIVEDREREWRKRDAVTTWLQGWRKNFPEDRYAASDLGLGARARILKLIHLILDASLNKGDERFSHDLEKQITSLYEAEVVFDL